MARDASRLWSTAALLVAVATALPGCGRGRPDDLWALPVAKTATHGAPDDVTGLWQGDVAMGGIRLRIERDRLTLALQCDANGDKRAQAAAPAAFDIAPEPRFVLREALAGGDKDCGFRFNAGDALTYRLTGPGALEIAFAGASVARLAKIADLPAR